MQVKHLIFILRILGIAYVILRDPGQYYNTTDLPANALPILPLK